MEGKIIMDKEFIKRLLAQRANTWEQAKALLDTAASEDRDLSAEEQVSYDRMNVDLDAVAERVKDMEAAEQRSQDTQDAFKRLLAQPVVTVDAPKTDALRAFLRGESGRAYDVPVEARADMTTTTGASVIPAGFHNQLWEYMVASAGLLDVVDVINTTSGEAISFPRVTAYSTVASTAETVALTQSEPTLSAVSSTVAKQGYLVQISSELLADSAFNIEAYLSKWAGRELGNAVGATAATVALAAAAAGTTGATGTTLTFGAQSTAGLGFDYLISLFHSVLAPYRNSPSCAWVMADTTAAIVRKIKSADGVYAWSPSLLAGQPDLILGKPVVIDGGIPVPAANAESIVFGDFGSIKTRIAGGFRFERSDDFAFNEDVSTFRAIVRHGSVSVDANALKTFTHSAT
jgi:HK97 family phage major capsid protein